ncbi:MAG: DUF3107 domain-containing protein [Streptosporangiaceae bacterium]
MEVKIGIQSAPRELVLETEFTFDELEQAVRTAIADGSLLVFADDKGGKILVPADKLAYLEAGPSGSRQIGFGAR